MNNDGANLPRMKIDEAREIGELCANLKSGYPPTNPNVLIRAASAIEREGTIKDKDLLPSILRWAAAHA